MTTKIILECPDTSHWHVKVTTQDRLFDPKSQKMTDAWGQTSVLVLKQGEKSDAYITSSRRLIVEEIEPVAAAAPVATEKTDGEG